MYTCTLVSAATPSGGPYTRARAARTFSPDMDSPSLRPLAWNPRDGRAAVQPVDDAHQLEHVLYVVVGAGLLGVERVSVTREHGLHPQALRAHDIALGPVADHHRLLRLDAETAQPLAERRRVGLALAGVVERDHGIEHVLEPSAHS